MKPDHEKNTPRGGGGLTTSRDFLHKLQGVASIDLNPIALPQSTPEPNRRCREQSNRWSEGGAKNNLPLSLYAHCSITPDAAT